MSGIGSGVSETRCTSLTARQSLDHLTRCACLRFPQYDLSASTFSPDGRIFQTDYAQKAVDNSGCGRRQLCVHRAVAG
jgi:hypothetical protein